MGRGNSPFRYEYGHSGRRSAVGGKGPYPSPSPSFLFPSVPVFFKTPRTPSMESKPWP